MSEETKRPAVGETWETSDGRHVELAALLSCGKCYTGPNGGAWSIPGAECRSRIQLVRRVSPAPEQTEEPKVGETWEHSGYGPVVIEDNEYSIGHHIGYRHPGGYSTSCERAFLIRRLDAPPSVPVNAPVICADCGKEITNPLEACVRTKRDPVSLKVIRLPGTFHAKCPEPVATPTPKPDPYLQHGIEQNLPGDHRIAQMMAERDARLAKRARFTADTLADFDRPMLKLGGRFGRVVESGHPRGWPEGSDHE